MSVLAVVPARGGSVGIARKNMQRVGGATLVERAVATALSTASVQTVVVSSDDSEILDEGRRAGAQTIRRPDSLATDTATSLEVVLHAVAAYPSATVVVLLQPTSPFCETGDVEACLSALRGSPTSTTVTALEHPLTWQFTLDAGARLVPVAGTEPRAARRQDASTVYRLNGAVYAARVSHLREGGQLVDETTIGVPMELSRSIDIDEPIDLALAQLIASGAERPKDQPP